MDALLDLRGGADEETADDDGGDDDDDDELDFDAALDWVYMNAGEFDVAVPSAAEIDACFGAAFKQVDFTIDFAGSTNFTLIDPATKKKAKEQKDIPEWKVVRPHMKEDMVKICTSFDASRRGDKRAWSESKKATKDLTSDEVLKRGSAAVEVFMKWLEACRLVRTICEQMRAEEDEASSGKAPEGKEFADTRPSQQL